LQRIALLGNQIQEYAWGSRTALGELLGTPVPTPAPQAELWMGAHPKAPSRVLLERGEVPLPEWIRSDPEGVLGPDVARRFGGELPFLFKVLAAEAPLSIQAHPNAEQAARGFARENERGLGPDAPDRSYRDPRPKPELICALTRFRALKGFRRIPRILELLERLAVPALEGRVAALRADPSTRGLARFFREQLCVPSAERARLAEEIARRAAGRAEEDRAFAWVATLQENHPGDPGVLSPLLLNTVELAPGQGLYLGAGELHSYLEGVGIEAMASSDNVLRGGLTPKHVDVDALMSVLTFAAGDAEVLEPAPRGAGVAVYETPAAEFEVAVVRVGEGRDHEDETSRGVEIWICTEGAGRVEASNAGLAWRSGSVWIVPAAVARYRVCGSGVLYRASVPTTDR
jgi:mannose-6-phosphate isomerase